jgi:NAD(P)-dependent dehydrogenase (short-subunit alcohol dehydrogenase family)
MNAVKDKTILITGATDGLGFAVAEELAVQGARLILHGRDAERLKRTRNHLSTLTDSEMLETERADFMFLQEVDDLANRVLQKHDALHVLINNAGIGAGFANRQRVLSKDGIEARLAVNYLAGYHLTKRLLPLLKKSAPSRIINVASAGQQSIEFDNLQLERDFDGWRAYAQSKLAQILFTFDLAEELKDTAVTVNALHPASLMPTKMVFEGWTQTMDSLETGVNATHNLVLGDVDTGNYFDRTNKASPNAQANDKASRARLKQVSDDLIAKAIRTLDLE